MWRLVRKLQGHVTNENKKTTTCSVDGNTSSGVEVSAISTTSQTGTPICRPTVDNDVTDVTNDGRLFHARQQQSVHYGGGFFQRS